MYCNKRNALVLKKDCFDFGHICTFSYIYPMKTVVAQYHVLPKGAVINDASMKEGGAGLAQR